LVNELGRQGARPEGPRLVAQKAESGDEVLVEGAASPGSGYGEAL